MTFQAISTFAADRADPGEAAVRISGRHRLSHALARRIAFRTAHVDLPRGMVSFSFDDFPDSAATTGAAILEEAGCRGTFYAASGQLGSRQRFWTVAGPQAVTRLHERGHEIGLHSHGHGVAPMLSTRAFTADLAANRAALRRLLPGLANETYAYPYGYAGLGLKRRLGGLARAARSVQPGLNAGHIDLDYVRAVSLFDCELPPPELERLLDEAAARRAWLVFFTHDVTPEPSAYGASPALLRAALAGALRRGLAVRTMAEALDSIGAP